MIIDLNRCSLNELGAKLHADHDQPKQSTTHGRLLALATAYFLYATNHKMPWRAIFDHQLSEGRTAPPEYREDQDRLFALVEECLANDIAEKDQRKNAARALFASVNGIVSLSLDRKLGDFEPETTRRQIEFLKGCTAHGLHQTCKEQC